MVDSCLVLGKVEATEGDTIIVPNAEQWRNIDNILTVEPSQSAIFPSAIFTAFPLLEKVHMVHFGIRSLFADTFQNASDVEKISLEANSIGVVPKNAFAKCVHLIELDLSRNVIEDIEDGAFSGLASLKKLHLNDNKLTALRRGMFADLIALVEINLQSNAIDSLEEKTFALPKLEIVSMSENRLKTLPDNLFGPSVQIANFGLNRITHIGNAFANATQLVGIMLGHNPLEDLNFHQLAQIPKLYGLILADTGLTVDALSSLSTLPENVKFNVTHLDISGNRLSNRNILSMLKSFSSLGHLNVSNNEFTTIDGLGQIKKTFTDILSVDVNDNRLTCEWLKAEVDEAETTGVVFSNQPTELKNYKWTTCL